MTRFLRSLFVPVIAVGLAVGLVNCKTECKDGVCTAKSVQGLKGTPVTKEATGVAANANIVIRVNGGTVRAGDQASTSITVNPGGEAGKIKVIFTPVMAVPPDEKDALAKQMNDPANGGNLVNSIDVQGGTVNISVTQTGTYDSSLTATADVILPSDFAGTIDAQTGTGDIAIKTGFTNVTAVTGLGDVAVDLGSSIIKADGTGTISTKNGDITFTVPVGAQSPISAVADGPDSAVLGSPGAGWTEAAAAVNSKTYNAPMNVGAAWKLTTGLGKVQVNWQ